MRAIELFAGAGGLGIGISRAGFSPVEIVERDRWCCDTIRENKSRGIAPVASWPVPFQGDVRSVDFTRHEGVDIVSGGPPCQPFSLGGRHRAHSDDRDMWSETVRAVRQAKPRAFIFENVKGLTRESFASYLAYIVHQLTYPEIVRIAGERWEEHLARLESQHTSRRRVEGLSYNVVFRVLNAANYGIPQRRERVVFVGFRSDLGIRWSFPDETHSRAALLRDQAQLGGYWDRNRVASRDRPAHRPESMQIDMDAVLLKPWRTVRDAISDLPDPEFDPERSASFLNHRFQPGARSYHGHTGSPLDEPAKTLKAGVHGVPGGENMLVRPDGSIRYFSVRESARLQTFPDDFAFHGSWTETMRQLGNAVPVDLATIVARHVSETLALNSEVG